MSDRLDFRFNDGGRSKYFKADHVGDCVTRAIAIVTGKDYKEVYNEVKRIIGYTPRNGVHKMDTKKLMKHFGGKFVSTMKFGKSDRIHLKRTELPSNARLVCRVSKHLTTVINGEINDTYDPSRDGSRMVYGYWIFK